MPLSDDEAREAYSSLVESLRAVELSWVVEQVEVALALGKPESRRLRKDELSEPMWQFVSSRSSPRTRGAAAKFVVAEEYTAKERLTLIIDAIRAAVIQTDALLSTIAESLPPELVSKGIQFRPELESAEGFTLPEPNSDRRQAVAKLASLLDELESQNSDDAPKRIAF